MIILAFMINEYNQVTITVLYSSKHCEIFLLNDISFEIKQSYTWGNLHWDANCVLLGYVYVHSMFNQALGVYFNILLIDLTGAFISFKALLFYRVLLALNYTHRSIHYRLSVDESLSCLHSVTTGTWTHMPWLNDLSGGTNRAFNIKEFSLMLHDFINVWYLMEEINHLNLLGSVPN